MPLDDQTKRWTDRTNDVHAQLTMFLKHMPRAEGRVALRSTFTGIQQILHDPLNAAASDTPIPGSQLAKAVEPFITAMQVIADASTPNSVAQLISHLTDLSTASEQAITLLQEESPPQSVDEVIEEFANDFRLSLLATLTANSKLVELIGAWNQSKSADPATGDYLKIAALQFVPTPEPGTVPVSVVNSLLSDGPSIWTPTERLSIDRVPALYRMVYGQWFTYIHATWEDVYRDRLAAAHGPDDQGNPWQRNDIKSQFFNEIRLIRHDIAHHAGICEDAAENELIRWAEPGEPIAATPQQMLTLLDSFPFNDLRKEPTRSERTTDQLPWSLPSEWVHKVKQHVLKISPRKKDRSGVVMSAIDSWMEDKQE
ncbi:hypothetical protein ACWEK5_41600 [Rhodococcus koreensis]